MTDGDEHETAFTWNGLVVEGYEKPGQVPAWRMKCEREQSSRATIAIKRFHGGAVEMLGKMGGCVPAHEAKQKHYKT